MSAEGQKSHEWSAELIILKTYCFNCIQIFQSTISLFFGTQPINHLFKQTFLASPIGLLDYNF